MRTMTEIDMELQALEDAICLKFIPALTRQNHLSDEQCNLLLPARTGGLGLNNPVREAVTLQKQIGCFNHRLVTLVADKLWL